MSILNIARLKAREEGIKITQKNPKFRIQGYCISECCMTDGALIELKEFNEHTRKWDTFDCNSDETCFSDARKSARAHLR